MSEEEQIQMAMQLSIKHTERKGQDSRKPISTATDDVLSSPLPKHPVQVCITFLLGKMKNSSLRTVFGMPHMLQILFLLSFALGKLSSESALIRYCFARKFVLILIFLLSTFISFHFI